jgi:putative membrane protein
MMWDYGWGGGAGAAVMFLFWLVFLAAVVVGVVFLVRALTTSPRQEEPRERQDTARELLRRRYAAGDIEREEYLRRRQDLEDG